MWWTSSSNIITSFTCTETLHMRIPGSSDICYLFRSLAQVPWLCKRDSTQGDGYTHTRKCQATKADFERFSYCSLPLSFSCWKAALYLFLGRTSWLYFWKPRFFLLRTSRLSIPTHELWCFLPFSSSRIRCSLVPAALWLEPPSLYPCS